MITFTLLNFFLIYMIRKNKSISKGYIVMTYLISVFLFALFGIEYAQGNVELFTSDEAYYYHMGKYGLFELNDSRFLWFFLNYIILNYDIAGDFFLKVINIPILIGVLIILTKMFKTNKVFNVILFLPYLAFMATYNMRDTLILLVICSSIYAYYNKKFGWFFISIIILYLNRPQFVFVTLIVLVLVKLIFKIRAKEKLFVLTNKKIFMTPIVLFAITGLIAVNYNNISTLVDKNLTAVERHLDNEEEFVDRMERVGATGNIKNDLPVSMLKYTFSPTPQSLLSRIINGGVSQWSLLDDLIRLFNQVGYYLLLLYIGFNFRRIKRVILDLDKVQLSVILVLFSFMPIYSFYLYGVMHQRLRLPFQIMIFLIALLISTQKKKRFDPLKVNTKS